MKQQPEWATAYLAYLAELDARPAVPVEPRVPAMRPWDQVCVGGAAVGLALLNPALVCLCALAGHSLPHWLLAIAGSLYAAVMLAPWCLCLLLIPALAVHALLTSRRT